MKEKNRNQNYEINPKKKSKKYGREFSKENWDLDSTSLTKYTNSDTNTILPLIKSKRYRAWDISVGCISSFIFFYSSANAL